MKSIFNRSEMDVESMWNRREIDVRSKSDRCETEVISDIGGKGRVGENRGGGGSSSCGG